LVKKCARASCDEPARAQRPSCGRPTDEHRKQCKRAWRGGVAFSGTRLAALSSERS
jgi:hypothetical protein